ncbi:aldolase/citrate lyase family protein [Pseudoxanthobacter sp.]|uniref:HpcH/HpaI aldolase family protein n=1 Tax=Pseudoxanthobacter sp. TaxID=1925742 RepID=UPI002FE2D029
MTELLKPYDLARRLRAGEVVQTAWSISLTEPAALTELAAAGYPAVTFDMQHGIHDVGSIAAAIPQVVAAGAAPVVRIPVGAYPVASRVLDFGAVAVIAPMIESAAQAAAFVQQAKYPPVGQRSWGAASAMRLAGVADPAVWLQKANDIVLTFAMIESRPALEALPEILAVPGLDGVFVGPADLSIALSNGSRFAPSSDETQATVAGIATRARAAGRIAGAFAVSAADAQRAKAAGFSFIALGVDFALLGEAARATIAAFNAPR